MTCPKCGEVHDRCGAHNRAGKPCQMRPMKGQRTCKQHGGKTPVALAAAERRLATADAKATLQLYGEPVAEIDPSDAVMDALRRTVGHVAWLSMQVAGLPSLTARNYATGADSAHVLVELYERERDRVGRLAKAAHDMGIADRQVRLEEQRGELMAGGVMWLLTRLGADDDRGRGLAAEMFQALAVGQLPAAEVAP